MSIFAKFEQFHFEHTLKYEHLKMLIEHNYVPVTNLSAIFLHLWNVNKHVTGISSEIFKNEKIF